MSFVVRSVEKKDLKQLVSLAGQFNLLNMPADEKVIREKIERSIKSFSGRLSKKDAEYLFVCEDLEINKVVGSSLILAKHGTEEVPHNYIKIEKKKKFSEDLGIGFTHKVLKFCQNTDGPTEIGGLLVDREYRRRPEKLGKQISLSRFIYMALHPEKFEEQVLCELTPPFMEDGRSEFWEALGRRFTGLPYQEADKLSQMNKGFIKNLFPEEGVYLTLLDSKARYVLGQVGESTMPAKHLLESIGFKYLNEVDPFDGGPHYGAKIHKVSIVKNGKKLKVVEAKDQTLGTQRCLVGGIKQDKFRCVQSAFKQREDQIFLPTQSLKILNMQEGSEVFWSPI